MDVVVEVGGWEHECCGQAIELGQLVDLQCIRYMGPGGHVRLIESHHEVDVPADVRVQGRVTEIRVIGDDGFAQPILRVPSGSALAGFEDDGDGHLEDPWTGDVISSGSGEFLVSIRTSR